MASRYEVRNHTAGRMAEARRSEPLEAVAEETAVGPDQTRMLSELFVLPMIDLFF